MGKRRTKTLADVLIDEIKQCKKQGVTEYRIAKNAGIGPEIVGRFYRGADIRISTADKIADALGYELVKKKGK